MANEKVNGQKRRNRKKKRRRETDLNFACNFDWPHAIFDLKCTREYQSDTAFRNRTRVKIEFIVRYSPEIESRVRIWRKEKYGNNDENKKFSRSLLCLRQALTWMKAITKLQVTGTNRLLIELSNALLRALTFEQIQVISLYKRQFIHSDSLRRSFKRFTRSWRNRLRD